MTPALRALATIPVVTACLLAAVPLGAAEERPLSNVPKDEMTWLDARASELRGKKVVSPEGKALGEIKDLIVDVRRGTVAFLALSSRGLADAAEKLTLVPATDFTRGEVRDRLVLDIDHERLRSLPAMDKSDKAEPADRNLRRASELMGRNVKDRNGNPAGEIEDLVVNLGTGRVEQVMFAHDGRKAPEPKRALPLNAFSIPAEQGGEIVLKSP
jgi:sporulation protein YlmC with PRC-barrel domain